MINKLNLNFKLLLFVCAINFIAISTSNANNVTWLSAVSGNWNDGTKWSGGSAPGVNDTAVITVAGTYTITQNVNASIAKLVLGGASGKQTLGNSGFTLTIANPSIINANGFLALTSATINGAGSLQNDGVIQINSSNSISVALNNNDTIYVRHQSNTISGAFTSTASAMFIMDGSLSHSIITFTNGWTNNGMIKMTSATTYYSYLVISNGVLINASSGTIQSDPNPASIGYHRIDGRIDNQGLMNINYNLRLYSTATGSINSGTLNIASGKDFIVAAGVWNYNGGTVSATGRIYVENATANFNTATMPAIATYFTGGTLGSSIGSITSSKKIQLANSNTISVNLILDDTLEVMHQTNNVSGNFSTTSSAVILLDGVLSHSTITFANGFTNNGKILMTSATTYYSTITITSGILTNAAAGIIQCDPNPASLGYYIITGRLDNQGTMNINYNLRLFSSAGGSTNTGSLNIAAGKDFIPAGGVWNYNGGTVSTTGRIYVENATANFNTPTMPNIATYFTGGTLGSSLGSITSSKKIQLGNSNTISANLELNDTLEVMHQTNNVSGNFSTTTSAMILMDGVLSHSTITFANGFTNNGMIKMTSATSYYSFLTVTSGVLSNAVGATIQMDPNPSSTGYHRIDGRINNQGTMNVNYTTYLYTNSFGSTNTGTLNIASGMDFIIGSGVWNYNGGAVSTTGRIYVSNATANFNTPTMPNIATYFTGGTLGSSLGSITSSHKIQLANSNTVSANLILNDTLEVMHQTNNVTGNFSTTSSAVIYMDGVLSHSTITFANGYTNNGMIKFTSATSYYSYLTISNGVLINAPGAIIQSDPSPTSTGYHRIDGRVDNQGTMNINYTLRLYSNVSGSTNTGTLNIATNQQFIISGGVWNWNGGVDLGSGQLSFENATGNFNTPTMPHWITNFTSSTLGSTQLPVTSSHVINLNASNTISAAIFNTDTIKVHSTSNSMSGALTTATSSVIYFDGLNGNSIFTINSGFTNNGQILLSSNYYYSYLTVSTGVLINSNTGIITSNQNPNAIGYHRLDAALNNQGIVNVSYTLRHYTNAGASHNTGTINIVAGVNLEVYNGVWHWDGGTASGTGLLAFYSATGSFNTATMPPFYTYFSSSSLASTLSGINNNKKIRLGTTNTVTANLNNVDTILVQSTGNNFTGNYTNTTASLLWFDGVEGNSVMTFANGFTNNGKILMQANYYYGYMIVTAGVLTNAATGNIITNPDPYAIGYYRIDAAINNVGTINVNYLLYHYTNAGASHNTGTIIIAAGKEYRVYNGIWHWDGGTATGTGLLSFYSATGSFNTATMPPFYTYFTGSTLASTLSGISNSKKIRISNTNNITANLNNVDTILIQSSSNNFTGNFTNTVSSILWFDGVEGHSIMTFANGFTNNGKLLMQANYYYGYLILTAGVLTNSATGIITTNPDPYAVGYYRIDGAINNQGTINVNYLLYHYTNTGASHNTGTINIAAGKEYRVYNGTWHWDGGTAIGAGLLSFYSATGSFNTATMPPFYTYFTGSTLASTLSGISNSKKIRISNTNNITANLNNTDTILVQSSANNFTGNYTNTTSSVLMFDGVEGHSIMTFANGFTNNGIFRLNAVYYYGYPIITSGTLTNASTGLFSVEGNPYAVGYQRLDGNFVNNGITSIAVPFYHYSGVFTNSSSGTLKGGSYLNNQGTLLTNNGTISPGSSPGQLQINANIKNGTSSIWNIEVGGLTVATQYDQIDNNFASTKDTVDGTLNISLINSFVPSLGDSVIIEKHNLRVGTFATVTGQAIPGGLYWNVFYRPNTIVLRAGNPPNQDIIASAGPNGIISPSGTVSVVYNGTQTFNFIPNTNYVVDSFFVDGVYTGNATSYTFNNVIASHTISVKFKLITWTITASANGNGTITPSGSVIVNQSNNQLFNIAANPCNILDSVIVDGVYVGTPSTYTFSNVSANHTIYARFSSAPHLTADGALTFCTGITRALSAGATYSAYLWSTGATTQTIGVTTSGTYTCTITSTGGCTNSATMTVVVNPLPVVTFSQPYPGDNGHACITDGTISLSGSGWGLPSGGFYNGSGVTFSQVYLFTPGLAGVGAHSITYTYTDGNGCTNTVSNSVTVDQNATADAGQVSMVLCNTLIANLSGSVGGSATSGTWTTSGNGSFNNANALNAIYTLSPADSLAGTVTLTLTSNNPTGPCVAMSDQIVLYYNPDAVAYAGADQCSGTTVSINGSIVGYAANPHWTTLGTGTFTNANALSTIYNASLADSTAGFVNLILTPIDPNGNCTFTPDTVKIYFDRHYSVNAGSDVTICNQSTNIVSLNGSFTNAQSVTWTTSGSGNFGNANNAVTTYTLSPADIAYGNIVLSLTSNDPVGPCTAFSDYMIVKYKYAIVDAGIDACGDTISYVSSTVSTNLQTNLQLSYQWSTNGSGTFATPNAGGSYYHASNTDVANGSIKIYVQAIDAASECTYNKDSMTLWFNRHYSVDAGNVSSTICANTVMSLTGTASNVLSTTWNTSGDGVFGNIHSLITTYTPGSGDTTVHTVKLYLTSDDPIGACSFVRDSMTVFINGLPHATAGTNSPVCIGNDLDLTASGGLAYSWSGPGGYTSNAQNIIRTPATLAMNGTYTVTITDANTCTNTATTVAVVQNCGCTVPVLAQTHVDPTCFGSNNGSIDLTIVSGIGVYSYQWSNGATTEDLNGIGAGTYICTVSAGPGCTDVILVQLNQPTSISLTGIKSNVGCKGLANGAINITATGGTNPFNYNWSNGNTTEDLSGLHAGTFTVTVSDANGCSATHSFIITEPASKLIVNIYKTNVRCGLTNSGDATCSPVGGTSPYTYLWNTGNTNATMTKLYAGTYTVTATDFNGCSKIVTFNLLQNPPIVVVVSGTNVTSFGGNNGTATATVTGGVAPYSYYWNTNPAKTTQSATGLTAGFYKVRIMDAKGCTKIGIITITQPLPKVQNSLEDATTIYPNPAKDFFGLSISSTENGNVSLKLIDASGREVISKNMSVTIGENSFLINTADLPRGVYFLRMIKSDGIVIRKISLN